MLFEIVEITIPRMLNAAELWQKVDDRIRIAIQVGMENKGHETAADLLVLGGPHSSQIANWKLEPAEEHVLAIFTLSELAEEYKPNTRSQLAIYAAIEALKYWAK